MNNKDSSRKAYIIGGGIAGLSAATFLIEDAGIKGENIFILDQNQKNGGSLDAQGSAEQGYSSHGYRLFEKSAYLSTYDLLSKISSPTNPQKTLKDDFFEFNNRLKVHAKSRLVKNGEIVEAHHLGLNWQDRLGLIKLLLLPEKYFGTLEIEEYFTPFFFETNFWFEWSTTFAFKSRNSLIEMRRYFSRFIQCSPQIDTMKGLLSAPYCEYDFIISPLLKWLEENKVNFKQNCKVSDIEFEKNKSKKIVTGILLSNNQGKIDISQNDLVFLTNGSITADASNGSMENPPAYIEKKSDSFSIWENISKKFTDLGNPSVFFNSPNTSKCESFTITFHDAKFFELIEKFTGNKAGEGGLITFKDSNWLMSIILPKQPYFINQPENTFVCWGYGLFPDSYGNHITKVMSECSGQEILEELYGHLGLNDETRATIKNAVCIPSLLPYSSSQFLPRKITDRPKVVPNGSQNFACIGQYVEIPNEVVFTVEYSIRSAKIAVKKLLHLPVKIPTISQKKYNIKVLFTAIKTAFR